MSPPVRFHRLAEADVVEAWLWYEERRPGLNEADEAMYQAKRAGGARHQLIDLRERRHSQRRADLEADLRVAARRGELRVEYQPIVRTVDGEITAIEALLRWDHPQRGLISPTVAIPIAEQSDLISEIGCWVLERACTDRNRLQQAKTTTGSRSMRERLPAPAVG